LSNNRTLVAIYAHPDDEAFGSGGTLTKYTREGVAVHLIMATRGEAGRSANPAITVTQPMSLLRERELRQASEHYGLAGLHFLDYMDGQTAIVPPSEAVYKIVKLLRQLKPQVVLTFGPEGVYGHFDHLVVHRWATAAVELAAQADRWPETGPAHQTLKLYHRATPQIQVEQMQERFGRTSVPMDGIPFPFAGYPPEAITTTLDVHDYAQLKLEAIRCYASQVHPDMPYFKEGFDPLTIPWFWQETFILAKNPNILPLPTGAKEDDFFARIS
jgi:LmbE family N-acetylglucosaminyl deacetylase